MDGGVELGVAAWQYTWFILLLVLVQLCCCSTQLSLLLADVRDIVYQQQSYTQAQAADAIAPTLTNYPPPVAHHSSLTLCLSAQRHVCPGHRLSTPPTPPAGNLELESVDLSGCRFLTAFSCASPVLQQLTAASCSRLHSLTLATHSLRTLLLPNCKALANIHASAAAPAGATASAAAGATAVDDEAAAAVGRGGRQQVVQDGSSSNSSRGGGSGSSRGGSSGRRPRVVLDTKGCVSLTAEGRAKLAAAMAV